MRIGEILALTKDNIDLKENTITIDKTLTRNKEDKVILGEQTKTKFGKRTIYLSSNAKLILQDMSKSNISNIYNLIFYDYTKNDFITPNQLLFTTI